MVPPNNAAHLSVNWKSDQKHNKEIEVTLVKDSVKKNTIKDPPNKKRASDEADPCKSHLGIVKVKFTQVYGYPNPTSYSLFFRYPTRFFFEIIG